MIDSIIYAIDPSKSNCEYINNNGTNNQRHEIKSTYLDVEGMEYEVLHVTKNIIKMIDQ